MKQFQSPDTQPWSRAASRIESCLGVVCLSATITMLLPGDTQVNSYEDRIPEYIPTATASHTPSPEPTTPSTTIRTRECKKGTPRTYTWTDMGIINAPIELVGDDPANPDRPDVPHGRDKDGAYNTVGFYEPGPRPGAEEGTPYFIIHSTRNEKSLLYPRDEKIAILDRIRHLGKTSTIEVTQDNRSICRYEIDGDDMYLKVDKVNGYPEVFPKLFSLKKGQASEQAVIAFCSGQWSDKLQTSKDIALLRGKSKN